MAIGDWSGRRLIATWVIGLGLQAALLFALVGWAKRDVERNAPRARARWAALDERWKVSEAADAASQAAQRAEAIASGKHSITAQGDTSVAVVRMPSGRPAEASVAFEPSVAIPLTTVALFGGVPLILLALTTFWILSQRRQRALEQMDVD